MGEPQKNTYRRKAALKADPTARPALVHPLRAAFANPPRRFALLLDELAAAPRADLDIPSEGREPARLSAPDQARSRRAGQRRPAVSAPGGHGDVSTDRLLLFLDVQRRLDCEMNGTRCCSNSPPGLIQREVISALTGRGGSADAAETRKTSAKLLHHAKLLRSSAQGEERRRDCPQTSASERLLSPPVLRQAPPCSARIGSQLGVGSLLG
ncbi:hypothetical protein AOLI_G00027480 [Acnodon oligacanthus]